MYITHILLGYLIDFLILFWFINILACHFENIYYSKYIYQHVPIILVHALCIIQIVFFLLMCLNSYPVASHPQVKTILGHLCGSVG